MFKVEPIEAVTAASLLTTRVGVGLAYLPLSEEEDTIAQELHTRFVAAFNAMGEEGIPVNERIAVCVLSMVMIRIVAACEEAKQ